jgi:hypothetical protein
MGGARALIASLGASISLVAGAALSLLVISFVFAYDGFTGGVDSSPTASALVIGRTSSTGSPSLGATSHAAAAVVIRQAAAVRPARGTTKPAVPVRRDSGGGSPAQPAFTPRVTGIDPIIHQSAPTKAPAPKPQTGDGVRDLGDAVSATVQDTGAAAGKATAPLLGPPVSKAVQQVLDLVTALLKGATDSLAGTLDKAVPR